MSPKSHLEDIAKNKETAAMVQKTPEERILERGIDNTSTTSTNDDDLEDLNREHSLESSDNIDNVDHHHYRGIEKIGTDPNFKRQIVWFNTLGFLVLHLTAVLGVPFGFLCNFYTVIWSVSIGVVSGEGVTLGAHRLYSHKAFKATKFTKAILLILQTIAGQNCMYIWVRDHRQHHKFSDTDADPHNANRGFFFSHVGWLMSRKHPEVLRKGKTIDMSDLEADQLVMFQKRYYKPLYAVFAIAIPILTPVFLWNENIIYSFFISYMTRYIFILNITWLVNSAAHFFGTKPYDRTMRPVESAIVAILTAGEGWHNYHHAFPWDYRAAELGMKYNFTTFLINTLERFGFVYDLKTAPYSIIEHRVRRTGDGTHRTIRPITDTDKAREIQTENREMIENQENLIENVNVAEEVEREVLTCNEDDTGSFEKCIDLFVKGLEAEVDDDAPDKKDLLENNNSDEANENGNIYVCKGKFEVCELGYNVIRQRPI